jgi:hypothetical protein
VPLGFHGSLLLPTSRYPVGRIILLFFILMIILVLSVGIGGDPEAALTVLHRLVLASEVDASALHALLAALRKVAGTRAELGRYGSVLLDPVGKGVFAILDDPIEKVSHKQSW